MNSRWSSPFRVFAALMGMAALSASSVFAGEGAVPAGVPHLDHVWVIMMENHAYGQIVGNPSSPAGRPVRSGRPPRPPLRTLALRD